MFEDLPQPDQVQVLQARAKAACSADQGAPRLLERNRSQIELRASDLESLLAEDHRARLVWGYVVGQDLSQLVEAVKARGSNAGRAAIDPRILFALWLYATLARTLSNEVKQNEHWRGFRAISGSHLLPCKL